jgi:cytochrome c
MSGRAVVGHDMADVRRPDGRLASAEVVQPGVAKGSGWLDSRGPDPVTKRIALKANCVLKVDDRPVCGSGYYKGSSP